MYVSKKFNVFILNPIAHEIPITLQMSIPYDELYIQKKFFNLFDIYDVDPLNFLVHFNNTNFITGNIKNIYAYYANGWSLKYTSTAPQLELQRINKREFDNLYDPLKNMFSKLFIKKPKTIEFFNLFCLFNHLESLNHPVPIKTKNHLRHQMITFLKEYKNLNDNLSDEEIQIQLRRFFPFNLYGNFYTQMFYFLLLFNNTKYKNLKNFLAYLILSTFEFNNLNESVVKKLVHYINGEFCLLTKLGFKDIFDKNIGYGDIISILKNLIKEGYKKPCLEPPQPLNKINFNIEPDVLDESVCKNEYSIENHEDINTKNEVNIFSFKLIIEVYKPSYDTLTVLSIPIENGYIQIEPVDLKPGNLFYKKFFVNCKVIYDSIEGDHNILEIYNTNTVDKFSQIQLKEIIYSLNGVKYNEKLEGTLHLKKLQKAIS